MRGLFVIGTDTEVGKTETACALIRRGIADGLIVAGHKPVASGSRPTPAGLRNEDAERLLGVSSPLEPPLAYEAVNPVALEPAIAPHIAAAQAGISLDLDPMERAVRVLSKRVDAVVVEGAGGLRVPLGERTDLSDLAVRLGLPVVLVVGLKLGCINHALLTAEALERRGIELAGWVGSAREVYPVMEQNVQTLRGRLPAPVLAVVGPAADPESALLDQLPAGLL